MIAKKIQSNICGILKFFRSTMSATYGCHTPELRAYVHIRLTEPSDREAVRPGHLRQSQVWVSSWLRR